MKHTKHTATLSVLLVSCALSIGACFGGPDGVEPVTSEPEQPAVVDNMTAEERAAAEAAEREAIEAEKAEAEMNREERLEAERVAREMEAERSAAEMAEAERLAAEKAEAERVMAEMAEADRVAAEKAAAEKAEAERIAAEKSEAEKAEAARVAKERAEAERVAAEKEIAARVEAERVAAEKAAAEKAEADRVAAEKAEAERIAAEMAEADRIAAEKAAAEKAEMDRVAAEKAEMDRLEAERMAAEMAEADRVAAEKAEAERMAAEKAEMARLERERIASEAADRELAFYVGRARRELNASQFEEAEKTLSYGLERYPGNQVLADMRNELRTLVASSNAGVSDGVDGLMLSTLQEYEREADKMFKAGRAAEDGGDWEGAVDSYTRLLQLIEFAPYKAELREKYEAPAKANLSSARVQALAAREAERNEQLQDAERIKDLTNQAVEQRKASQVVELWRKVLYNMDLKRFNDAEDLINNILDMDPGFEPARALRGEISNLRLANMRQEQFERRMIGYKVALLELQESMAPDTALIRYPGGELARRIHERKRRLASYDILDKETQSIKNALESTIDSVNWNELPLNEVIADIRKRTGVNILAGSEADTPVTLQLSNMPMSAILQHVLKLTEKKQVFLDGVLFIKDASDEETGEEKLTVVHDIRDITYVVQDFRAPKINLRSEGDSGDTGISFDDNAEDPIETDTIIDMIETSVGEVMMKDFGGQLIVTAPAAIQGRIRDFLDKLREVSGLLVAMEARFITIRDDFLSDFGIDFRGLGGGSSVPNQANVVLEDVNSQNEDNAGGAFDNGTLGVPAANPSAGIFFNPDNPQGAVNFNRDIRGRFENIFDNALGSRLSNVGGLAMQVAIFQDLTQINMVIRAVQKKSKGRTLIAPRLSAFNTQRANIAIINQIPYIQDFQVQAALSSSIANPILDTILDGIVMEVRPTVSNDRRFITMEVQPTIAELVFPIPTFVTTLGPTSAVTIQIPELKIQSAKTTVRVPDGGAVVIGGLKTVRRVDMESSTPILGDLPLIGILFRRKARDDERQNLVIVIKAHIIDLNDEELRQPGWN